MESIDDAQSQPGPTSTKQAKKPYIEQPPTSLMKRWIIVPTSAALIVAMMPLAVIIHATLDSPLMSIVILTSTIGFFHVLDKLHGEKPNMDADDDSDSAVTLIVNDAWAKKLASLSKRQRRIKIKWLIKRTMRVQHLVFLVGAFTILLVINFLPLFGW